MPDSLFSAADFQLNIKKYNKTIFVFVAFRQKFLLLLFILFYFAFKTNSLLFLCFFSLIPQIALEKFFFVFAREGKLIVLFHAVFEWYTHSHTFICCFRIFVYYLVKAAEYVLLNIIIEIDFSYTSFLLFTLLSFILCFKIFFK